MVNLALIFLNSIFACCYGTLALSIVYEIHLKLNNQASRILQSRNSSFDGRILVVNLLQLLLSCALITSVRLLQACPYPGKDYVLGLVLMLLMKALHLKKETFLQDLVGILSISSTALVSHHMNTNPESALEEGSRLLTVILFRVPGPVILTLITVTTQTCLTLSHTLSLIVGCISLLCISLHQRNSKLVILAFCILLLHLSYKYQDLPEAPHNQTSQISPLTKNKMKTEEYECENDPLTYLTLQPILYYGTDTATPQDLLPCTISSALPMSSIREVSVLASLEADGTCLVEALDLTGSSSITKYLVKLLSVLLPSLELAPRVTLTGFTPRCSQLAGSDILTERTNQSCYFSDEDIILREKSLTSQILSVLNSFRDSVLNQFL